MLREIEFHISYMGHFYPQMALMAYLSQNIDSRISMRKVGGRDIPDHLNQKIDPSATSRERALHITMHNLDDEEYPWFTLQVDEYLLKNCVPDCPQSVKDWTRSYYRLGSDRPLVMIGRPHLTSSYEVNIMKHIKELSRYADIFFIGMTDTVLLDINSVAYAGYEERIGFQKMLLSIADASLYLNPIVDPKFKFNRPMHDIFEGTQNCIHFHRDNGCSVYGYDEMKRIGSVRAYQNPEVLLNELEAYVEGLCLGPDQDLPRILADREEHMEMTRETFLPIIKGHVDQMLGLTNEIPYHPDLVVSENQSGDGIYVRRIRHARTHYQKDDDFIDVMSPGQHDHVRYMNKVFRFFS